MLTPTVTLSKVHISIEFLKIWCEGMSSSFKRTNVFDFESPSNWHKVGISSRSATLLPSAQRSGIIFWKLLPIFCKNFEEKYWKLLKLWINERFKRCTTIWAKIRRKQVITCHNSSSSRYTGKHYGTPSIVLWVWISGCRSMSCVRAVRCFERL